MPILDPAAYLNETLVVDPVSEDAANSPLTLTSDPYGLLEHHYPQPPIDPQWASSVSTEGSVLASQRYQNREISITVDVSTLVGVRALQAKLAKLAREGGTLQRTMSDATVRVFDVLTCDGYDPAFDQTWHLGGITQTTFSLTCKPFARGALQTLTLHTEPTLPALVFTETGILGDVPALGRLSITNNSATNAKQRLLWGVRSLTYSTDAGARFFYEAEAMTAMAATAAVGTAGASGAGTNKVMKNASLTTSWADQLRIVRVGPPSAYFTHLGTYRVFARVLVPATNTGTVSLKFTWASNRSLGPYAENDPVTVPVEGSWLLADLGQIHTENTISPFPLWQGFLKAMSTIAGDDLEIDCFMFIPVDEGAGEANAGVGFVAVASGQTRVREDMALTLINGVWEKLEGYAGDYLTVPVGGTSEFFVKFASDSTGTLGLGRDVATDSVSAQLTYIPRYLAI